MLRILFAGEDLGRVRVARRPHALWETVLSLQTLRTRRRTVLAGWRDDALTRLATPRSSAALRVLGPLVPTRGYFPDFLTPADGEGTIADGIAAVMNTPRHRVAGELELLLAAASGTALGGRAAPDGARDGRASQGSGRDGRALRGGARDDRAALDGRTAPEGRDPSGDRGASDGRGPSGHRGGSGDRGAPGDRAEPDGSAEPDDRAEPYGSAEDVFGAGRRLGRLGDALAHYHEAALAPYMPRIRALVDADRAVRARALLDGGVEALLETLRPVARWRPPVLEADYPVDQELRLDGRGLLLVPSVFCDRNPITFLDPSLPPTLVYPVEDPGGPERRDEAGDALAALIGGTRGAVLRRLGEAGASTGELARLVGISAASASQHASVLRRSGLVVSRRAGNTVVHHVSPLGAALLRGGT